MIVADVVLKPEGITSNHQLFYWIIGICSSKVRRCTPTCKKISNIKIYIVQHGYKSCCQSRQIWNLLVAFVMKIWKMKIWNLLAFVLKSRPSKGWPRSVVSLMVVLHPPICQNILVQEILGGFLFIRNMGTSSWMNKCGNLSPIWGTK